MQMMTRAGEQEKKRGACCPARVARRAAGDASALRPGGPAAAPSVLCAAVSDGGSRALSFPGLEGVEVVRSRRKTLALEVKAPARVIVRAPMRASQRAIREFVEGHRAWIAEALARVNERAHQRAQAAREAGLLGEEDLKALAAQACQVIPARVAHFAPRVGVTYGRIALRCQKTRWGSCSAAGNLNFNVLLMLAPPEVLDYVVVHELCHRIEMNHSPRFWALVAAHDPGYRAHRTWLKQHGSTLMARAGR